MTDFRIRKFGRKDAKNRFTRLLAFPQITVTAGLDAEEIKEPIQSKEKAQDDYFVDMSQYNTQPNSPTKLPMIISRDSSRKSNDSFKLLKTSVDASRISRNSAQNFRSQQKAKTELTTPRSQKVGTELTTPRSVKFASEFDESEEQEQISVLDLHRVILAEQKEQWRRDVVVQESKTSRDASQISERARKELEACDETLNEERTAYGKSRKIVDKLEKTCVRKHNQAVKLHEQDIKDRERRRLFLGLHIDRRAEHLKRKPHPSIAAIFRGTKQEPKQSAAVRKNRLKIASRYEILKEMGVLDAFKTEETTKDNQ